MKSMPGLTLADATERMFRDGAFMRVYWEGAAIMLLADQRLRSRTGGAQSLDSALARLRACCLSPDAGWQARELFAKLDELTQTGVFGELYEAHVASAAFPPVADAYRLLGLELEEEGASIHMLDAAPEIAYRDAIMRAEN
jgi:predicted metalloprotease with PDZ domain